MTFNGANYSVYVRKRPFLDRFFQAIAGKFEVTVFTASQQVYAEKLLNLLDPAGVHSASPARAAMGAARPRARDESADCRCDDPLSPPLPPPPHDRSRPSSPSPAPHPAQSTTACTATRACPWRATTSRT